MAAMVVLLTIQVVGRYALSSPPDWTEELARSAFLYITFIGAAVAIARGANLKIDAVLTALPTQTRTAIRTATHVIAAMFLAVVTYQGVLLVDRLSAQPLTALPISKGFFFAALPIGTSLMLVFETACAITAGRALLARRTSGRRRRGSEED